MENRIAFILTSHILRFIADKEQNPQSGSALLWPRVPHRVVLLSSCMRYSAADFPRWYPWSCANSFGNISSKYTRFVLRTPSNTQEITLRFDCKCLHNFGSSFFKADDSGAEIFFKNGTTKRAQFSVVSWDEDFVSLRPIRQIILEIRAKT